MVRPILDGHCEPEVSLQDAGPISYARWLTCANRVLPIRVPNESFVYVWQRTRFGYTNRRRLPAGRGLSVSVCRSSWMLSASCMAKIHFGLKFIMCLLNTPLLIRLKQHCYTVPSAEFFNVGRVGGAELRRSPSQLGRDAELQMAIHIVLLPSCEIVSYRYENIASSMHSRFPGHRDSNEAWNITVMAASVDQNITERQESEHNGKRIVQAESRLPDVRSTSTPPRDHCYVLMAGTNDVDAGHESTIITHLDRCIYSMYIVFVYSDRVPLSLTKTYRVLVLLLTTRYDLDTISLVNNYMVELCHRHQGHHKEAHCAWALSANKIEGGPIKYDSGETGLQDTSASPSVETESHNIVASSIQAAFRVVRQGRCPEYCFSITIKL
ncbi:hypothetical protein J6590_007836 [Homalodisca vitripennis]|nr:hypothetical protein J6590_007836 [Homalodisca vitripennis]